MATKVIESVLEYGLEIAIIVFLGYLTTLRKKIGIWLETRTTTQQRDLLHRLAGEAVALAESIYFSGNGPSKLRAAMSYVNERLEDRGIDINAESIRGAIEKSVMDYNVTTKAVSVTTSEQDIEPIINAIHQGEDK